MYTNALHFCHCASIRLWLLRRVRVITRHRLTQMKLRRAVYRSPTIGKKNVARLWKALPEHPANFKQQSLHPWQINVNWLKYINVKTIHVRSDHYWRSNLQKNYELFLKLQFLANISPRWHPNIIVICDTSLSSIDLMIELYWNESSCWRKMQYCWLQDTDLLKVLFKSIALQDMDQKDVFVN